MIPAFLEEQRNNNYIKQKDQAFVTSRSIKIPTHSQNHDGNWPEKALGSSHGPRHTRYQEHEEHVENPSLSKPCKNEMPTCYTDEHFIYHD